MVPFPHSFISSVLFLIHVVSCCGNYLVELFTVAFLPEGQLESELHWTRSCTCFLKSFPEKQSQMFNISISCLTDFLFLKIMSELHYNRSTICQFTVLFFTLGVFLHCFVVFKCFHVFCVKKKDLLPI